MVPIGYTFLLFPSRLIEETYIYTRQKNEL